MIRRLERAGRLRIALVIVDALVAVTALGGGVALAIGIEGARFPVAWLRGTPFDSYVLPGLILAIAVGGSAAVAATVTLRGLAAGARASVLAGVVVIGWIVGEILILTGDAELVSPTEAIYLALGLLMAGLGLVAERGGAER